MSFWAFNFLNGLYFFIVKRFVQFYPKVFFESFQFDLKLKRKIFLYDKIRMTFWWYYGICVRKYNTIYNKSK
ncbi:hypothetical protein BKM63_08570 [Flavobacterium johnsoniae]|uniref:Uncharacterized protein n=1 Tax=Flavobacterium johnsoniae TaxID=986 RepID=A0A1J7BW68_FLAJO|nr:hypothetical protein BKM63_08570 [Flavobacterium johnsoniae]